MILEDGERLPKNICATCRFCHTSLMSNNHGAKTCNRRTVESVVHGTVTVGRTAEFERSRLWCWLGMDTCGPEGRYWEALPPPPSPPPIERI